MIYKITTIIKTKSSYLTSILGLSFQIAKAEFKLRNEGSYLGIFWYLLSPVLTFTLLFLIFSDRLGNDIPLYSPYLLLGIIIFNFFQSTTLESTRSLAQENHFLLKSINFPKESLIISVVLKNLLSHLFEILIFSSVLIYFNLNLTWILYYIPLLFLFSIFVLGISLILSSLTVYFIDLENIWNFVVRLIWFGTPIFYIIAGQTKLFYINTFNPLYYFITVAREVLIYHRVPETWILIGVIIFSILSLIMGLFIFSKLNKKITELI